MQTIRSKIKLKFSIPKEADTDIMHVNELNHLPFIGVLQKPENGTVSKPAQNVSTKRTVMAW